MPQGWRVRGRHHFGGGAAHARRGLRELGIRRDRSRGGHGQQAFDDLGPLPLRQARTHGPSRPGEEEARPMVRRDRARLRRREPVPQQRTRGFGHARDARAAGERLYRGGLRQCAHQRRPELAAGEDGMFDRGGPARLRAPRGLQRFLGADAGRASPEIWWPPLERESPRSRRLRNSGAPGLRLHGRTAGRRPRSASRSHRPNGHRY
mmetsp:Transcript_43247/g.119587  ORF Transcript_43247/g.119587 Transcript_43247/m.119587 type:complete len:207 (-) Transcript_43247:1260-1880(-)